MKKSLAQGGLNLWLSGYQQITGVSCVHITLLLMNPKRMENVHKQDGRNKNNLKTHQQFPECFHFPTTNLLKGKHLVMHTTL